MEPLPLQPAPLAIPPMPDLSGQVVPVAKCSTRGCRGSLSPLVECSSPDCNKQVHETCHERIIAKHSLEILQDPHSKETLLVCSKTCYNKVEKKLINQPSRLPWSMDGPRGTEDSINSEAIMLDWLLTEGNYARFRGNNDGTRKQAIGKELSLLFKDKGIKVERSPQAVVKKIQSMESQFSVAHDWVNNTGQGVKESDGDAKFEECVRKRCKWYFELEPIMADRAKARPKVTTDTIDSILLDDSDDEDGPADVSSISSETSSKKIARQSVLQFFPSQLGLAT